MRFRVAWLIAGVSLLAQALPASAHDIPSDVQVQAFIRPSGDRLQLLVRVPLKCMRDVDFPQDGSGFLEATNFAPLLRDAATLWISDFVAMYEERVLLPKPRVAAVQVSLESNRSFQTFGEALRHVTGPMLSGDVKVVPNQALFDVLFEYPIHSRRSRFSIRPGFERLGARVVTVLHFVPPDGSVRSFEFFGNPGLVALDPAWYQAALTFVSLGFFHILDGTDHLLFLLCLAIPFRQVRGLLAAVTAFTLAHSITLAASALHLAPDALWFPPLVETLIAVSIVWMALENIIGKTTTERRWIIAFCFGLVHGFGFSFALRETLQLAGTHLLSSLLAFNVGVELGQVLVLATLVPALYLLFQFVVAERMGTILLSAFVAHTGWHWTLERGEILRRYSFDWASLSAAQLSATGWLLLLIVIVLGIVALAVHVLRQTTNRSRDLAQQVIRIQS